MNTLFLDIETSPNVGHVWGLWQQNIGLPQLIESSYTMCWSAKWAGQEKVLFDSTFKSRSKKMIKGLHSLIDKADMVVHYNGTSFDMPTANKEFLLHELPPPSPVKQIDLLRIVRAKFRFPSNKLNYVAQRLGLGKKFAHEGHTLWIKCMNNDPAAWKLMEKYNKHDVVLLEKLYYKLRPWIKGSLNTALFNGVSQCPTCGSTRFHKRGFAFTSSLVYQRYQCQNCKSWFRGSKNIAAKGEKFIGL